MDINTLTGHQFLSMVQGGLANLEKNRTLVNDLNVFPVPDGDTGDNMVMTVQSGLHHIQEDTSLGTTASQIAKGMLLGARGNSGVILSCFFHGMASKLQTCQSASIKQMAEAFSEGVKKAYESAEVPVEGTILTVCREAIEFANAQTSNTDSLKHYFTCCLEEARRSLQKTPTLLKTLESAGVVDSGGAGFVYMLEGMKKVLDGEEIPAISEISHTFSKPSLSTLSTSENSTEYGYCTEFLLRLLSSKTNISIFDVKHISQSLKRFGNSIMCLQDEDIIKIHIHTMTPGDILNYGQQFGEFLSVKIENMSLQHQTTLSPLSKPKKKYAIVVVSGTGMSHSFFEEMGVDKLIRGGEGVNPPVEEFLNAFEEVNAETIFVLPNNKNILFAAKQASTLFEESEVRVLPSVTIGEGYAALSMYDTSSENADIIEQDMLMAMEGVVTGEVSCAIKEYVSDNLSVKKGEYIGFVGNDILVKSDSAELVTIDLTDKFIEGRDVVLIIYGSMIKEEQAKMLCETLQNRYHKTEFILIEGQQNICDYILIFE